MTESDTNIAADIMAAVAEVKEALGGSWAVAELIRKYDDYRVRNAMAKTLEEQHENGAEVWAAACEIVDRETEMDDAVAKLTQEIDDAISAVSGGRRSFEELVRLYHVEYAEGDGGDIGHHLAVAGRALTAARALHRVASK